MKKNIKRILILPLIICLLFSSLCLYSCSDQPVTKWHYGEEKPGKSLVANVGDCYLEYESCDVYTYTEDGWELSFNMKGEDGKNGKNGKDGQNGKNGVQWLSGEQKPDVLLGKNGDRYLWTKNMTVYEKKLGKWYYQMNFSSQRVYDYSNDSDGELKILCIGNSFSIDTMQYVYQILQDLGIQNVTLGNIHKPGCPVGTHYTNIKEDNAAYTFYYNDNGKWKPTGNYTIKQALLLEDWDFISFQQKSGYSGKPNSDYFANLQPLADEVRKIEPNATFL